ncbi:MAG: hypothetical protein OEZ39_16525 [Gammaproteobacteria bacterium]|nr:hypothetical protein [Gammaproteobacteria bacterium]MDH5653466.1 hypothetical protein [Gammaproteobacteria bacterium]
MGFFDSLKKVANTITGGSAEVFLDAEPFRIGEPFEVKITAKVKDADLDIKRVYLKIVAKEEIQVPHYSFSHRIPKRNCDDENEEETIYIEKTVKEDHTTLKLELNIAGNQVLKANQAYEWIYRVDLPDGAQPVYRGKYCIHAYEACAGLDCFGNDPDSGWQELLPADAISDN